MTRTIPPEARAYKRTPTFTETSTPEALRKAHSTKAGVWGKLRVTEGRLLYVVDDPAPGAETVALSPDTGPGIILPQQKHHVEIDGPVAFHVEFYAIAAKV